MSDPIAEAAANLNDAAPSSTEPVVAQEVGTATPGESLSPSEGSQSGSDSKETPSSSMSQSSEDASQESAKEGAGELVNAAAPAQESTGEHPHTSILRRLTETLRRKWNVFDGEIEAILKDAESRL
jgi:hypothetical protein